MAKKEKKVLVTGPKVESTHTIEELRERKKFIYKVALISLAVIGVALAIAIPWWLFIYKPYFG